MPTALRSGRSLGRPAAARIRRWPSYHAAVDLVEAVGAELVEHERPAALERPRDAIEVRLEALAHVVEDAARDDRVEAGVVLELLELDPPEDRPVRGGRVDRRDLVTGCVEGERELPPAAPDFQYPRRARGQMR